MIEIANIKVTSNRAEVVPTNRITSGLVGATISVEYDASWDNLTRTVVFKGVVNKVVVTNDTVVKIPWEVLTKPEGRLSVGFLGTDGPKEVIPTFYVDIGRINPGADPSGDPSVDPTLPVWAQLAERVEKLENKPGGGGSADLTGYAKEDWVRQGFQPKGDYLTKDDLPGGLINTASGNPVVLDDSAEQKPLNLLKLFGKTTQSGTPSPDAPVPLVNAGGGGSVGVTVMGRNLFNWLPLADGALGTSNGTLVETGDHYVVLQGKDGNGSGDKSYSNGWYQPGSNTTGQTKRVFLNKGDIVTVSADYTMLEYGYGSAFNIGLHLYSDGKTMANGFDNVPVGVKTNVCRTFTVSESNAYYPVFSLNSGKVRIENIQIEYGTAVTAYEPYKASQTLTVPTPNGLPGIPVTSGGNYTDSTGQQWVCDEIDFTEGVYVQRVRKYVCTGTEVLASNNESNWTDKTVQFLLYFNNATDISVKDEEAEMLFTHGFVGKPPLYHPDKDMIISGQQYNRIYFGGRPAILGETRESVRAYLKAQYDAGTPLEILYKIITPIETPLSDLDFSALHTHYPNTTVFNDAGAGMEVKYVADTKRYIDKKFDQLAAAIVSN